MSKQPKRTQALRNRRPHALHAEQLEARQLLAADLLPQADLLEGELTLEVAVDDDALVYAAGSKATNSGTFAGAVNLSASVGNVEDNGDGTWTWTLDDVQVSDTQTVTISADDGALALEEVSFELTVESVDFELLFDTETDSDFNSLAPFLRIDEVIYFTSYPSLPPTTFWKTDGTPGGTTIINQASIAFNNLTDFNGVLFYTRTDGSDQSRDLWKYDETTGQEVLVYDFSTTQNTISTIETAIVGSSLYFNVDDGVHGQELWVSDGTTAGTHLVADITSGLAGSKISKLTATDNFLFFRADDGVHGTELWRTDGTEAGTVMVTDIFDVDDFWSPNNLTAIGDVLFFTAQDEAIWMSDGTTGETTRVFFHTSEGDLPAFGRSLRKIDDQVYYTYDNQVWVIDEPSVGPTSIATIPTEPVPFLSVVEKFSGALYVMEDSSWGTPDNLWKIDESTGETTLVASFRNGSFDIDLSNEIEEAIYFRGYDPTYGYQTWRSDGTPEGTTRISSFATPSHATFRQPILGPNGTMLVTNATPEFGREPYFVHIDTPPKLVLQPVQIGEDNQSILLSALGTYDLLDALSELQFDWDLDGDGQYDDASGLTASISFADLATLGMANISLRVIDTDGKIATRDLVIDSNDPILTVDEVDGLVVTEGETAANTGRVAHVLGSDVQLSASIGDVVDNGDGTWSWSYTTLDGPDETQTVTITVVGGGGQTSVSFPLVVNNKRPLFIGIHSPGAVLQGETAFMSGTWSDVEADTVTVTSSLGDFTVLEDGTWTWSYDTTGLSPGNYQSNIIVRDEVSGSQYSVRFSVAAPLTADQPYVTTASGVMAANSGIIGNGGEATVTLSASLGDVIDHGDGTWSWGFDTRRTNVGSQEVTITATYENGVETSTTFQLAVHNLSYEFYDLRTGSAGSYPSNYQRLGDYVYFLAAISGYRTHLFRTDAVSAPQQITGGLENPGVYNIAQLLFVDDTFYLLANDAEGIASIWKTDGAPGQIEKVADVPFEPGVQLPAGQMAYANGYVYFGAFEESTGRELWRVNVASGQVEMVADITPGEADSRFYQMFSVGDVVYFSPELAFDKLWRTDGTAEGTYQVVTPSGSDIRSFSEFNGKRYFVTDEGAISTVWRVDESGPTPIFQGAPGQFSDWSGALYEEGDHLLFRMSRWFDAGPLWRWNETTEEMELVAELGELGFDRVTDIVDYDGQIFLRDSIHQYGENGQPSQYFVNLWRTDGTPAGTERLVGQSELPGFSITRFFVTNQGLLLSVNNDLYGRDLWKSDGTKAGTYPLLLPEAQYNMIIGRDISLGQRLIKTLGTSPDYGTELYYIQAGPVVEISGPATGRIGETVQLDASGTYDAIDAQEDLIFAWDIDGDGQYDDSSGMTYSLSLNALGSQTIGLRVTDQDGTSTYAVASIVTNMAPSIDVRSSLVSAVSGDGALNDGAFADDDLAHVELSASLGEVVDNGDGTWSWSLDTRLTNVGSYDVTITATDAYGAQSASAFRLVVHNDSLHEFDVHTGPGDLDAIHFRTIGDYVYFTGRPVGGVHQLFRTDGVSPPEQITGVPGDNFNFSVSNLLVVRDTLYFLANDAPTSVALWKTDGTPGAYEKIANLPYGYTIPSPTGTMAYVDGTIFLGEFDEVNGAELWTVNVETRQFNMVADLTPGPDDSLLNRLTAIGDIVYFYTAATGNDPLWRSDGTAAGTYKVESSPGVEVKRAVEYGGAIFFVTNQGTTSSLWRIDATGIAPVLEPGLNPDPNWQGVVYTSGDQLLFAMSRNGVTGDVWRWNETTDVMEPVANLVDLGFSLVSSITTHAGILYIRETVSTDEGFVQNLWRTDGTAEGTIRLVGESERAGFDIIAFYSTEAGLFLLGKDADHGYELWKTDGTIAGTYPVTDWQPPHNNNPIRGILPLGQRLILGLDVSAEVGEELYVLQAGPVIEISGPTFGRVGEVAQFDASGTMDAIDPQQLLTFAWDTDGDGQYDDATGSILDWDLTTPGLQRIGLRVTDPEGAATYASSTILINAPPTVAADSQTVVVNEGAIAINSGVYLDSPDDVVTLSASLGAIIDHGDGTWSWSYPAEDGPNAQTVTITVTDSAGLVDTIEFGLTTLNVAPTVAANQSNLVVDATQTLTNAGAYADPGDTPLSLTASLGEIIDHGDGTWSWSYTPTLADVGNHLIQIRAFDGLVGGSVTFSVNVMPIPEASLTLNVDDAETDANGEVATLPESLTLIDEWDRFTANVWIKRPAHVSGDLTDVTLDLHYNSQWFQLTSSTPSSGVGQLEVENLGDVLRIRASQFSSADGALDGYLLLGSFRFQPTPSGGIPNDLTGDYPQPLDPQLSITDIYVTSADVESQFGLQTESPGTTLQVVPYDLDDDGNIGLVDLVTWVRKIGDDVATHPESYRYDFDRDGYVSLTDLAYLIRNIGVNRDSGKPVRLPPAAPAPQPLIESEENAPPATAASTASFALEAEAIETPPPVDPQKHDVDAAFGSLGLLEQCWELPTSDDEDVEETLETAISLSTESWRPQQLPDWALEASSIVECVADKAIRLLEDLEEEHPRLERALGRLKSRLEDL